MPVKTFRPLTPSLRYITVADFSDITKTKPEKSLVFPRKKTGGRNNYGRVTARGIGGGHKQKVRIVDFKRQKHGVEAKVHYPIPLYRQEGLRHLGYRRGDFPVADAQAQSVISFPCDQHLTQAQQDYVVQVVRQYYGASG